MVIDVDGGDNADLPVFNIQPSRTRRRSISRQEAIFIEPTGNSLENVSKAASTTKRTGDDDDDDNDGEHANNETYKKKNDFVQDIYLTVPDTDLKRDRAASVDSSFSKLTSNGKTEELQSECDGFALTVPSNALRSRSVDIVLPTNEQERYKALSLAGPSMSKRYVTNVDCLLHNLLHFLLLSLSLSLLFFLSVCLLLHLLHFFSLFSPSCHEHEQNMVNWSMNVCACVWVSTKSRRLNIAITILCDSTLEQSADILNYAA